MSETGDVVAHPLTAGVAAARAALAGALASVDFSASEDDLRGAVRTATALLAQTQALVMAVVAEADQRGVCERDAHTAVSWFRELALVRTTEARAVVRRSVELSGPCPRVGAALRRGDLSPVHADVVTAVLRRLPDRVDALTRARAEEFLVEQARVLDPTDLGGVAGELFERVAGAFPDVDDPGDARAVEREAERAAASAYERRSFDLHDRPDGEVALSGSLSGDAAAALRTFFDTASTPTRSEDGVIDERTATQRRADALTELVTATLDAGTLPEQGGNRPQVTVTVALETLQRMAAEATASEPRVPWQASLLEPVGASGLGPEVCDSGTNGADISGGEPARLDTGAALSPSDLRRLLCDAHILPVVLGGRSEPLDVGREQRLFTTAQRRAVTARDRGCVWAGCRRPPRATQVHHMTHWVDGGATSLENACLLCDHHHRQLHRHGWQARLASNGFPELVPPAHVDPGRRPRQPYRFTVTDRVLG